jgi:hypothetical protein
MRDSPHMDFAEGSARLDDAWTARGPGGGTPDERVREQRVEVGRGRT